MDKLKDKVVLITGAGKGSGRLLAQAFARQGAIVAANDISPVNVEEVVNQIIAQGGRAQAYIEDVAKKVAAQHIVIQVEEDFGPISILINHAAVEPRVPLLDMDEWDWHRVLDVNLTGAFLMTQSAGRVMRARGSGVIINLVHRTAAPVHGTAAPVHGTAAPVHGTAAPVTEPAGGAGNEAAFRASMQGLAAFTRQAARELSPYGIQIHLVESTPEKIVERVFALLDLQVEGT